MRLPASGASNWSWRPPAAGQSLPLAIDVEKIERVFFNLLSNALKYTPRNSSITVRCRCDARQLTFEVADTGEGISEHDIGNIFDRFYQADRIHTRGSGIGLSLAKAFVELHGGTISVESQLHKGARFTVTLPVRHVAPATTEAGAEDVDSATGQHNVEAELETIDDHTSFDADKPIILVIDDNRDIRLLIKELMSADYNILTASNGREGGAAGGQIRARPGHLRRHDAGHGWTGVLPAHQERAFDLAHPGSDADGMLDGRTAGAGIRQRSRRLSLQAIQQRRAEVPLREPHRQPETNP